MLPFRGPLFEVTAMRILKPWSIVVVVLLASAAAGADKFIPGNPQVAVHQQVESVFSTLYQTYLRNPGDERGFEEACRRTGVGASGFRVEAEIFFRPPSSSDSADLQVLEHAGFRTRASSLNFIEGSVPIFNIFGLPGCGEGVMVRKVRKLLPEAVSEGLPLISANVWKSNGSSGMGVKIAVIDMGFFDIGNAVTNSEMGAYTSNDFTGTGFPGTGVHGTACAEIIYDIAPSATYYLLLVATITDIQNAATYCSNNGIDVVSFSLGIHNGNFLDGQGTECTIVDNAASNGILWVESAGNEGMNEYWIGNWNDSNSDNYIEFSGSDQSQSLNCSMGDVIVATLTWDCSTTSSEDYDLELSDASGLVASSTNVQSGTQQPHEQVQYIVAASGIFDIAIKKSSAAGTSKFRLHCTKQLEYGSPASSLATPADAAGAFTVGAIDQANWGAAIIEPYSSRGPTMDGRTKPDICAPDAVSTYSYGSLGFPGTSASAPHVAGMAALYLEFNPNASVSQVRSALEGWALDVGILGKDNTYGAGEARMTTAPPVADFSASPLTTDIGGTVSFSDLSTGLLNTWSWDFGDAGTSTQRNPCHSYASAGAFTVTLIASGPTGNDTEVKTAYVTVTPKADFTASPAVGPGELTVNFTDTTQGNVTSWAWDFGDTGTSDQKNPTHVYTSLGKFTVSLTISTVYGSDSITRTDLIVVTGPDCCFSANHSSGPGPFSVTFADETVGTVNSWSWEFGDGQTSVEQNPTHVFASNGPFTVKLTVDGPFGTDYFQRMNYISATAPIVSFFAAPTQGVESADVDFTSSVFGQVTSYSWDFGDGGTATEMNPAHHYGAVGTYTVTLSVESPYGPSSCTRTDFITVSPAPKEKESGGCHARTNPAGGVESAAGFAIPFIALSAALVLARRASRRKARQGSGTR